MGQVVETTIYLLLTVLPMTLFVNIGRRKGWKYPVGMALGYAFIACLLTFLIKAAGETPELAIISLLFWFALTLLIAIAVPSDPNGVQASELVDGDYKKCPYCAEVIKSEAVKCRFCGSELNGETSVKMPSPHWTRLAQKQPQRIEVSCEHCGEKIQAGLHELGHSLQCPACCSTIQLPRNVR